MPSHYKNILGQKFCRLTVIALSIRRSSQGSMFWLCRCECGREKEILGHALRCGAIRSCGCLHKEIARITQLKNCKTHGKTNSRIYHIYKNMMHRCYDKKCRAFPQYGGRGIIVDAVWQTFEQFYKDMGDPLDGMSLDRIDNNKGYSKENCQWATKKQQANNRRSNKMLTFNGITLNKKQWAERIGITHKTLHLRLSKGWTLERALRTPLRSDIFYH